MPAFLPVQTDLEPCLRLMQAYYEFDGIEFNAARAKTTLEQMIAGNFGQAHIVRHNNHDVGYLIVLYGYSLEYGGRVLELDELFLIPEARALGLGSQILAFVEQQARAIGAAVISLETEHGNETARRFYQKHGYAVLERQILRKKL
jgi:GNAT superfamily N-acetyltransferase